GERRLRAAGGRNETGRERETDDEARAGLDESTTSDMSRHGSISGRRKAWGCGEVGYSAHIPTSPRSWLLDDFPDRQLPDPLARERDDRVAHGRRDRRRPGLAHAALRIAARHDVHLDVRHLGQPQHAIVVEVALLHPALVDRD